ncbi:hypothetical protein PHMEG_00015514 [Phytophthora megakarya]|uniref:Uncharacterized protein n=1 Tax=Phytophthora megakarya TaxID=4795 RepID=A0A225W1K7_9STRA|nr:hypothetical protein PHMEG_00015514 [Phytophthora megakarya]
MSNDTFGPYTALSAGKVSKFFENAIATDYTMDTINMCLEYAMGMRQNVETAKNYDSVTNTRKRQQRSVQLEVNSKKIEI